jgi:catechol 2,3-dioxygenase-like lactoylglutathione lyase family enzyme
MKRFLLLLCAAAAGVQAQEVTGVGNFSHIVANLDKSLAFYHDVLGLELVAPARPFDPNPTIMKLGDTIGAQSRIVQLRVPGSAVGVEIIEYKDIERKPAHPRFQDPGAANLALRTRDFDGVVERVKKAGAHVMTLGGSPVTIRGTKYLFLQDDDGFIVELSQADTPGGGFEVAVGNLDETVAAYRALELQPTAPNAWNGDKAMTDNAGTPGAQFRQSRAALPAPAGAPSAAIAFIEFKDIERKPLHTRTQDPGTAILQLNVRGLDAMLSKLKAAGFTVVSTGGVPVDMGGVKIALVRDLNNLFLELIERPAR